MEHMQRRTFLGTVVVAAVRGDAAVHQGQPFNTSGLSPEEYKQQFRATARLHGRRLAWRYEPGTALEPFLDWYPGDEWVSHWEVSTPGALPYENVNARSFIHEARLRGQHVSKL